MNKMQMNRQQTFYMKNLPIAHPLKQLYKDPYNIDNMNEYNMWKATRDKCSDKFPTNIHIRFTKNIE